MPNKEPPEQKRIEVTSNSSNIYGHTGYLNPQEALAKAKLALLISTAIKTKNLTQKEAAILIGVDQPKISAIIRGQLSGFTIDRLFRFLMALGMDIIIEVKYHTSQTTPVNIQVTHSQHLKLSKLSEKL